MDWQYKSVSHWPVAFTLVPSPIDRVLSNPLHQTDKLAQMLALCSGKSEEYEKLCNRHFETFDS